MINSEITSYVRAKLSELDNQKVTPLLLLKDTNLSARDVQKDILPLCLNYYNREVYNSDSTFSIPSDLMSVPNALKDLKVANGTKGTGVFTSASGSNNNFTITARQPGTAAYTVRLINTASIAQSPTVTYDDVNSRYDVLIEDTVTTANSVLTALNTNPHFSERLLAELSQALGTGAIVLNGVSGTNTIAYNAGTGSGWVMARQLSLEDFNRVSNNYFQQPTTTDPVFTITGGVSGSGRAIRILPETMYWSLLQYIYVVADMTADSSILDLPPEYDKLYLEKVMALTYKTLMDIENSKQQALEYQTQMKLYQGNYETLLGSILGEKMRLQSNDIAK